MKKLVWAFALLLISFGGLMGSMVSVKADSLPTVCIMNRKNYGNPYGTYMHKVECFPVDGEHTYVTARGDTLLIDCKHPGKILKNGKFTPATNCSFVPRV
ncbi:MAG TPA: hypothetical protein VJC17_00075 [Candidatus Dojkabacteria bacterium]|nr:hypothetical protein [Candidatus Dojkabacteria bacterium]